MSKYNNLHINKSEIEEMIEDFCRNSFNYFEINGPKIINEVNNQARYQIILDNYVFRIDCYFREDNKVTLRGIGSEKEYKFSKSLCDYIVEQTEYVDVPSINFSVSVEEEKFNLLVNYIDSIDGVELIREEKVNKEIGILYQFRSEIGDQITLTYYESTDKLLFQGKVMKLYIEVKEYLSAITNINTKKMNKGYSNELKINEENIKDEFSNLLENSYDYLNGKLLNFLYDSLVYSKVDMPLNEYSSYAFPALRALEGYIKKIFSDNNIDAHRGFYTIKEGDKIPYFCRGRNKYVLNDSLDIQCEDTCNALEKCYNYYNKHRHTLVHTNHAIETTRVLEEKSDAIKIIYDVFDLIDNTYENIN